MSQPTFPQRRPDGSLCVASRFSLAGEATEQSIQAYVAGWMRGIMATGHVDLAEDLVEAPRVVARGPASVDVVFDGKPGSQRWKDWLVYLTRDLASSMPGITLECFYDVVADAPHPASVKGEAPTLC